MYDSLDNTILHQSDIDIKRLQNTIEALKQKIKKLRKKYEEERRSHSQTKNELDKQNKETDDTLYYINIQKKSWELKKSETVKERLSYFNRNLCLSSCHTDRNHTEPCSILKSENEQLKKAVLDCQMKIKELQLELQSSNKKFLEAEKDMTMLFNSLELERKEYDTNAAISKERNQNLEKENTTLRRMLQEQQDIMGKIKQMSKESFMKVRKSHTIDNVDSFRKDLSMAKAQNLQWHLERNSETNSCHQAPINSLIQMFEDNSISQRKDEVVKDSEESSSDDSLRQLSSFSNRLNAENINISANARRSTNQLKKKTLKTIITANHVHINNAPTIISGSDNV